MSEKSQKYYVGSTNNLRRRLHSHNQSKNIATKAYVPWKLTYFEAYPTKPAALEQERVLKHHGRTQASLSVGFGLVDQPRLSLAEWRDQPNWRG